MEIANIINKNTGKTVCNQYLNRKIDFDKCVFELGQPLKIVYSDGLSFTHEDIWFITIIDEVTIKIETTKKVWILQS